MISQLLYVLGVILIVVGLLDILNVLEAGSEVAFIIVGIICCAVGYVLNNRGRANL